MDDNYNVFKGLMKPTKEKEEIKHLERDNHKDSYESSNLNPNVQHKPIMTTMSSEDINFDKSDIVNTPRVGNKHINIVHKVSFNEGISEINDRSDTK